MQQESRRFREFADELARTMSTEAFDILTQIGVAKPYVVGKRGRCWVTGYLWRHAYEAMLYPWHAARPDRELAESRIRKLVLRQTGDDRVVAAFCKGWKIPPSTDVTREVVHELSSVLDFCVYGPLLKEFPTTRGHSRR